MTVAIIDHGSGNLRSAAKALERAAGEAGLDRRILVTADPAQVRRAGHVVLPGVGAFGDCRRGLDALPGMIEALEQVVRRDGRPFLGICVGMQLMASVGREHGDHPGLDWIPGEVVALDPTSPPGKQALKVPHMGWNHLHVSATDHPVLDGLATGAYVYFVHGFELRAASPTDVLATTDYGGPVTAVVGRDNLIGTQFHPEKSQAAGLGLLANFLRWRP
jgi:glutamine amidotransferase